jgi:5-formaminoimidazole-4-carboxamide-1-beta-D-ribofuranosyl 5'-monophosphate synthetase
LVIKREEMQRLASSYDIDSITIGVLGSHSAEEAGVSAKSIDLPTAVICQKGSIICEVQQALVRSHSYIG